jgi:hypothetical protein
MLCAKRTIPSLRVSTDFGFALWRSANRGIDRPCSRGGVGWDLFRRSHAGLGAVAALDENRWIVSVGVARTRLWGPMRRRALDHAAGAAFRAVARAKEAAD